MSHLEIIVLALLLDAAIGEPQTLWSRVPHPLVALMGAAERAETRLGRGRAAGAAGWAVVLIAGFGLAFLAALIAWLPDAGVVELIGATVLMGMRNLSDQLRAIARVLPYDLAAARREAEGATGLDLAGADGFAISRTSVEAGGKGFLDAVAAPVFWGLLLGLPGLVLWRVIETADMVFGQGAPERTAFGSGARWTAYLMGWAPARLAALLIAFVARSTAAVERAVAEAPLWREENGGWPVAALASALGIALGQAPGDAVPLLNPDGRRRVDFTDLWEALVLLWAAWAALLILLAIPAILLILWG
ncbi:MAG: cobalamin biosynthesis protein [Pseudomonadota bacterium]